MTEETRAGGFDYFFLSRLVLDPEGIFCFVKLFRCVSIKHPKSEMEPLGSTILLNQTSLVSPFGGLVESSMLLAWHC
jgi:hypothetical protein